jgi:trans-aconitate methyltransferase
MPTPIEPSLFYTGIVSEVYAPLRSEVPAVEPYAGFIRHFGEPALELGCGTGDPLLDLRAMGLDVEGLDSSPDMLTRCRAAAAARGIDVVLYEQPMETMELPRRYRSIFVAGPSFNLLADDASVSSALHRVRAHLEPDGSALIPLFIPQPSPAAYIGRAREHVAANGRTLRVTMTSETRDESARVQTQILRYEILTASSHEVVERPWVLHWHTQDGFRALATAAGLDTRSVRRPDGTPANANDDTFVFRLTPRPITTP